MCRPLVLLAALSCALEEPIAVRRDRSQPAEAAPKPIEPEPSALCGASGVDVTSALGFVDAIRADLERLDLRALRARIAPTARLPSGGLTRRTLVELRAIIVEGAPQEFVGEGRSCDLRRIFCRNGAVAVCDGLLWFAPRARGRFEIISINSR
jgi:hypothetical protein